MLRDAINEGLFVVRQHLEEAIAPLWEGIPKTDPIIILVLLVPLNPTALEDVRCLRGQAPTEDIYAFVSLFG